MRRALIGALLLAGCAGNDVDPTPRAALVLPGGWARVEVAQRSVVAVPGSGGRLQVHLGDITRGQVQLTLSRADGTTPIGTTSVKEGDVLPFSLERRYALTVVRLENRLLGEDFAILEFREAGPPTERERIVALIAAVTAADVTFLRNDVEHDAAAAAAHLRGKWKRAGGRELTADQFIDRIASRSSTTGRPYRIRRKDGTVLDAGAWLREQLARQDR
ncbi:MAG: DUF5329 family protein [Planctomycetota bacterium]